MKEFLQVLLPRLLPSKWRIHENYFIRSFEGKSDLQNNIASKVKVFSKRDIGLVILHDQDSNDCILLKKRLTDLCNENGSCPKIIRIVCKELESWYLGDLDAIQSSYPKFKSSKYKAKAIYRMPDNWYGSEEMKKLLPKEFQKIGTAKKIPEFMNFDSNKSVSFNQTIQGLIKFFG